ncbi:chitin deacetylase [Emcibacter nanhaiensis]|uniref:Chitooligosaccharide deacetylase n=1 Tax=Emcibacter nanhaiensis TaxID=1505037 RepID=A0A501PI73_9PROT|nr:polysaccharide deacetylase family protein [Emcibacter nanhaiensis]TPD59768.1 chitin deacetylase [Emcibacter nanhaiensis]
MTGASLFRKLLAPVLVGIYIFLCSFAALAEETEDSAVVIMYHRFGEDKYPSTNITLEQFRAHIEELKQEKYNVVPLSEIIEAFENKTPLPTRTVAITIDDAYLSIYENAWPILREAGFPFTLFTSSEPVDLKVDGYMTWDQIREMNQDPLVSIGHHGHSHEHLLRMTPGQVKQDLETASARYKAELGYVPDILAYPFGEYSAEIEELARSLGLKAGFGQHSGTASSRLDIFALPRFAFNEKYATLSRFRLISNSRALPVRDILPTDPTVTTNPPLIGFTVDKSVRGLSAMSCFPSHLDKAAELKLIGGNRVEIRFDKPFPKGRSRVNCTMPGPGGRWYWFGLPFFVPGGTEPAN